MSIGHTHLHYTLTGFSDFPPCLNDNTAIATTRLHDSPYFLSVGGPSLVARCFLVARLVVLGKGILPPSLVLHIIVYIDNTRCASRMVEGDYLELARRIALGLYLIGGVRRES